MSSDLHLVLHQQDKIQLMEHFNEYVYQLKSVIDTQFSMTDLRAEVEDQGIERAKPIKACWRMASQAES